MGISLIDIIGSYMRLFIWIVSNRFIINIRSIEFTFLSGHSYYESIVDNRKSDMNGS